MPTEKCDLVGTYIVTQADVDAGKIDNIGSATTPDVANIPDAPVSTPIAPIGKIALEKTGTLDLGTDGIATVGDVINYTFKVTNTGNVTLTNVVVTDPKVTISGGSIVTMAPGAVDTATFTASYAITQADIDAGVFENIADVTAKDPSGNDVTDKSDDPNDTTNTDTTGNGNPDDPTKTPLAVTGKIALEKTGTLDLGTDGVLTVGDVINYTFKVTNTGNVTLTNVSVTDPKVTVSGGPIATLAPAAVDTATFTASYALTQADIDAGVFENIADVTAKDPSGNDVTDKSDDPQDTINTDTTGNGNPDDPTKTPLGVTGSIALEKEGTLNKGADGVVSVGDVINYTFKVTNTGNITLTNVVVTDPKVAITGGPIATMAPAAVDTTTFTASYAITQTDMDAGVFENIADVTAKDPSGNDVTDKSDDPKDTSNTDTTGNGNPDDPTKTPLTGVGVIALEKTGTLDLGVDGIATVGDVINYTFKVTNTGNVPLLML